MEQVFDNDNDNDNDNSRERSCISGFQKGKEILHMKTI